MPSSVSGRLISGSWTVARAAVTASGAGEPVSVSDIVRCVSFDGEPARRPTRDSGDLRNRVGCHCTAADGRCGPAEGDLPRTGTPRRVAGVSSAVRSATVRDAMGLGLAVGLYGAAFGAAADAAGLNLWQTVTLSALMFTGASQFALVGVLRAGGSALAAVGSALLLGTRNTVYGVRLLPLLAPRGIRRFGAAHWVIDETTALAVSAPERGLARLGFLVGGGSIFVMWNATTLVGAFGAAALGGAAKAALDAVVPAAFLALLWPRLRSSFPEAAVQRRVALGGAVVALVLTPFVPPGVQVVSAVVAVALAGPPRKVAEEQA